MYKNWTTLKKLIWLYITVIKGSGGGGDPTSDVVGTGKVDYMVLTA